MLLMLANLLGCLDYGDLSDFGDDRGGKRGDDDDDDDDDDGGGGKAGDGDGDDDDDDDDGGRGDGDGDGGGGDGGGADETCTLGVAAFCVCSEAYDYPCSQADMEDFYARCVSGEDQGLFECMTDFVEDDVVDCYSAFSVCLADYE